MITKEHLILIINNINSYYTVHQCRLICKSQPCGFDMIHEDD
jgi:hypothetical protein